MVSIKLLMHFNIIDMAIKIDGLLKIDRRYLKPANIVCERLFYFFFFDGKLPIVLVFEFIIHRNLYTRLV